MSRQAAKWLVILSLSLLFIMPGLAQARETGREHPTLQTRLKEKSPLRVGIAAIAPLAMQDKNGQWIGLEVDVARRLAADLEVELQLFPVSTPRLIPGLLSNEYDLIISGLNITPERALQVTFTWPYYNTELRLVASKQAGTGKTLESFNDAGVTIGLLHGHTGHLAAAAYLPEAKQAYFDREEDLLAALLNGAIPAAVVSDQQLRFSVAFHTNKLYLPTEKPLTARPVGIALRSGDQETLNFLNAWVSILLAENWIRERQAFWYEQSSWIKELPHGMFP